MSRARLACGGPGQNRATESWRPSTARGTGAGRQAPVWSPDPQRHTRVTFPTSFKRIPTNGGRGRWKVNPAFGPWAEPILGLQDVQTLPWGEWYLSEGHIVGLVVVFGRPSRK